MEVLSASLMLQLVEDLISSKNAEELLLKLRLRVFVAIAVNF